jgi:hypothetical protein
MKEIYLLKEKRKASTDQRERETLGRAINEKTTRLNMALERLLSRGTPEIPFGASF